MEGAAASSLATVLTSVGTVLTSAIGWMSSVSEAIVGNPLLLLGVLLSFVGFGIGMFKRLLNV